MKEFVNRDEELRLIDDSVDTLLDSKRLLRTPIIEFYGVEGIGKTALLKEVQKKCTDKSLGCIWADMRNNTVSQFIQPAKELLREKKKVVIIVDSLDVSQEQLQEVETELRDLIEDSNLFVVLASKSLQRFDNTRSITRKLTPFPLKPLDQGSCASYLASIGDKIPPELRDVIYEWTRGYPLAMDVMTDAIVDEKKPLDPRKEQDKKPLLSIITEKVIDQTLLSKVRTNPSELDRFQRLLTVLSVPRRFNLVIMQDVIEKYAPKYKLESSLAYITLPNEINEVVNVLSWDMSRVGYCIDAPVRNIFLLKLKIEQPEEYAAIHSFLAAINEKLAQEVSGPDRIRYLREFFYHLASSGAIVNSQMLTAPLEQLVQEGVQKGSFDHFVQFYEEFLQDEDLKAALGDNIHVVITFLLSSFSDVGERLPTERVRFLSVVERGRQIIQEEPSEISEQLSTELSQNQELRSELSQDQGLSASQEKDSGR